MAGTGNVKNLTPWQPGQHGGGTGIVRLPPELRQARRENMAGMIKLIHLYVGMTEEQSKQRLCGPEATQLEEMIQGQISKAKEGDPRAFQFIVEVMCGKIPESDELTRADTLTLDEKIDLMKKGLASLEEQRGR